MQTLKRFISRHWQTLALVALAIAIVRHEYLATPLTRRLDAHAILNPFFVEMGKWGIRFLLLSLACTPIVSLLSWRWAMRLRKPTGLLAFAFIAIHVGLVVYDRRGADSLTMFINKLQDPEHQLLGLAAFMILALLALTSLKPLMKRMGRLWKPLHRCVYVAGLLAIAHSLIATTVGKRAATGGPESAVELRVYLLLLLALLLVRVPPVSATLKRLSPFARRKPKRKRVVVPD